MSGANTAITPGMSPRPKASYARCTSSTLSLAILVSSVLGGGREDRSLYCSTGTTTLCGRLVGSSGTAVSTTNLVRRGWRGRNRSLDARRPRPATVSNPYASKPNAELTDLRRRPLDVVAHAECAPGRTPAHADLVANPSCSHVDRDRKRGRRLTGDVHLYGAPPQGARGRIANVHGHTYAPSAAGCDVMEELGNDLQHRAAAPREPGGAQGRRAIRIGDRLPAQPLPRGTSHEHSAQIAGRVASHGHP